MSRYYVRSTRNPGEWSLASTWPLKQGLFLHSVIVRERPYGHEIQHGAAICSISVIQSADVTGSFGRRVEDRS